MNEYDLLVVGSGPVGVTFARVVTDQLPQARVLMADSGPQVTTPPGANARNLPSDERARAQAASQGTDTSKVSSDVVAGGVIAARPGTHLVRRQLPGTDDQEGMSAAAYVDGTVAGSAEAVYRDHLTGVQWVPYDEPDHPCHGQVMQLDASPVAFGAGPGERRAMVGLGWFCAKDIRAEDRIEFTTAETDPLGMPAMSIHYGLSAVDVKAVDGAVDALRRAGKALGSLAGEPKPLPAGSLLHYQGSARMSPADDGTGVCDGHCRVHGLANLYVGGNGVIPTATACNPTLTSVALAVRAAEAIVHRLEEDR